MYVTGIRIASPFLPKARLWIRGRRNWKKAMKQASANLPSGKHVIWFHCASLGEFEQGRPVIEAFRLSCPDWSILLTFFSPSGYEVRKDYPHADHVFYLPADTPSNARDFTDIWRPSAAVFVKYEYWLNFFHELGEKGVPIYVISAIFRQGQHFFSFYGKWFTRRISRGVNFFVQDDESVRLLKGVGIDNAVCSGDTRFDRVYQLRDNAVDFPAISDFASGSKVLIAGSTWRWDEELLAAMYEKFAGSMKLIIAPHEVHPSGVGRLESDIRARLGGRGEVVRFSEIRGKIPENTRAIIIDRIGILSGLYRYGDIAYIGGGFGKGIHNILEPASFGLPVIFGPRYGKFAEARDLIKKSGAVSIGGQEELESTVDTLINDQKELDRRSGICSTYVEGRRGATARIMEQLGRLCRNG